MSGSLFSFGVSRYFRYVFIQKHAFFVVSKRGFSVSFLVFHSVFALSFNSPPTVPGGSFCAVPEKVKDKQETPK